MLSKHMMKVLCLSLFFLAFARAGTVDQTATGTNTTDDHHMCNTTHIDKCVSHFYNGSTDITCDSANLMTFCPKLLMLGRCLMKDDDMDKDDHMEGDHMDDDDDMHLMKEDDIDDLGKPEKRCHNETEKSLKDHKFMCPIKDLMKKCGFEDIPKPPELKKCGISKDKLVPCFADFIMRSIPKVQEHLGTLSQDNMECPTDIVENVCGEYGGLMVCMNKQEIDLDCLKDIDEAMEHLPRGMKPCSREELKNTCRDAAPLNVKDGKDGSDSLRMSVTFLISGILVAVYGLLA